MSLRLDGFCLFAVVALVAAMGLSVAGSENSGDVAVTIWSVAALAWTVPLLALVAGWFGVLGGGGWRRGLILIGVVGVGMVASLQALQNPAIAGSAEVGFWALIIALWALAWRGIDGLAGFRSLNGKAQLVANLAVPLFFGVWLLFLWQVLTVGFGVPQVLLPSPSMIGVRIAGNLDVLWADFFQTVVKAVLSGYVIGCGAGFLVSILVDRVDFLKRGLLPLGNMVSALPIVGVAPIMVMWFGFDWQSKAAVVVIMTFFPMLVNTVSGLAATGPLERELLHSYGAGYWQTLFKLRLPAAMPFIFNALKINSTLAMIGAIVAEFFGTPIVGMGFRISTEVGRMNVDMVWAEIAVAALVGSLFYGVTALLERVVTFWHPSYHGKRG